MLIQRTLAILTFLWCFPLFAVELPSVTLSGHTDQVRALAFSPDSSLLASAGAGDNTVLLWDLHRGEVRTQLKGHDATVTSLMFGTKKWLASASDDETIKLWHTSSGRLLAQLLGHHGPILSIAASPDGSVLASGAGDRSLRLWDTERGSELAVLNRFPGEVSSVAFAPNGRWIATGDSSGQLTIWDSETLEPVQTRMAHEGNIWTLAFKPNSRAIASGSWDGSVRLWTLAPDGSLAEAAQVLADTDTWVLSLRFSLDGSLLAGGFLDWKGNDTLRLWHTGSGELIRTLGQHSRYDIAFSPDGRYLASVEGPNGDIRLWESRVTSPVPLQPEMDAELVHIDSVRFLWDDPQSAVYYELQVAMDPGFEELLVTNRTASSESTLAFDALPQRCWWRVRSAGFGTTSAWSPARTFQVRTTDSCKIYFTPASLDLEQGQIADVLLRVSGVERLVGYEMSLTFDPEIVIVTRLSQQGELFGESHHALTADVQNDTGMVSNIVATATGAGRFSGTGQIAKLTLRAVEAGQTHLQPMDVRIVQDDQTTVPCLTEGALISVKQPNSPWDVNQDGKVNVLDFVLVGQVFGQPVIGNAEVNPDVNRDGVVNVLDFALVAQHFGEASAAPPLDTEQRAILTTLAVQLERAGMTSDLLRHLRVYLSDSLENELGQNFPNPLNPETWIPYQLSQAAPITLRIYNAQGQLVRTIEGGVRRPGIHATKQQAIYWDGRSDLGEPVPSGLYFYALSTPHFTQTRKMTIVR